MNATRITYAGRVQGVGFRWAVKRIAAEFDVRGFVQNNDDGTVEVVAHGDRSEVAGFFEAVRTSDLAGHIATTSSEDASLPPETRGFQIMP